MAHDLPRRFGAYVLEEFLAKGGMAEVFVGRPANDPSARRVCIKTVLPHLTATGDFATMFDDEVWLGRRLNHDNVVRTLDSGDEDGVRFMVMELIEGLDLAGAYRALRKRNRGFSVAQSVCIGAAMCRGLHHAHQLEEGGQSLMVVHRDVSPQNVLIDRSGLVKMTDFGIAKARGRTTHTQTGIVKGKVAYMAPEQALGGQLDHRVDQFAAATVVWEMLTGQRLFRAESDLRSLEKIIKQKTAPPSTRRSDVPARVDAVVLKALSKRPQDRWQSMEAFENALLRAAAQVPGVGDQVGTVATMMDEAMTDLVTAPDLGEGASLTRGVVVTGRSRSPNAATALSGGKPRAGGQTQTVQTPGSNPVPQYAGTGTIPAALLGNTADDPMLDYMAEPEPAPAPAQAAQPGRVAGRGGGAGNLMVLPIGQQMPSKPGGSFGDTGTTGAGALMESTSHPVFIEQAFDWRIPAAVLVVGLLLGAGVGWFVRGIESMCAPVASTAMTREHASQLLDAAEMTLRTDMKATVENLKKSIKMHGSARGYVLAGKLRAVSGDHTGALEAFRCALQNEPQSVAAKQVREELLSVSK